MQNLQGKRGSKWSKGSISSAFWSKSCEFGRISLILIESVLESGQKRPHGPTGRLLLPSRCPTFRDPEPFDEAVLPSIVVLTAIMLSGIAPVSAGDWPTILGPTRDGVSTEKGIIAPWPKAGLKKLWDCDLGTGFAPPVVAGRQAVSLRSFWR